MNTWLDNELPDLLADLEEVGANRMRLLVAVSLACIGAVVALSAAIGYLVVGGDQATPTFVVALGLLAGPGVLGVVLAYLALVRGHLNYRFAADVMVPFLRERFGKFRYDSVEGLDDQLWRCTGWFPDDVEHSKTTHRTHFRVDEDGPLVRFCHLVITPPFSVFRRLAGRGGAPEVEGLFGVVEDTELPGDFAPPDIEKLQITEDDESIFFFLPATSPVLRADPRNPVVDEQQVREFLSAFTDVEDLAESLRSNQRA